MLAAIKELCVKVFAAVVLLVVLILPLGMQAQQADAAATNSSNWNNNDLIAIQKRGGDPTRAGEIKVEFYGHNAFKITSPIGVSVLTDPWRNDAAGAYPKWFLNEFPAINVDIVLSTHAHFDHEAVERPQGLVVLERMVGQFRLGDVEILGLADKHKCDPATDRSSGAASQTCPPNNVIGFDNAIQVIETGRMRIGIWGDNRAAPDPALDRYLKNLDVLILPVETVLTRDEVGAILRKYDPKAVIPAHYFLKGLTTDMSGLESADGWVIEQEKFHSDVRRLDSAELKLTAGELKGAHHRIYYFGDHFAKN